MVLGFITLSFKMNGVVADDASKPFFSFREEERSERSWSGRIRRYLDDLLRKGNSTKRSQFAVRFFTTLDSPLVTPLSAWWPFLRTGVLNCRKINRFYGSTRFIYFGKPFGSRIVIFAVNQAIKSDEQLISRVVRSSCLRSLWIFFD